MTFLPLFGGKAKTIPSTDSWKMLDMVLRIGFKLHYSKYFIGYQF